MKTKRAFEVHAELCRKLRQATNRLRADPECGELRQVWEMAVKDLDHFQAHGEAPEMGSLGSA